MPYHACTKPLRYRMVMKFWCREVQQQLGGGIVRTIAMGSSDGLRCGLDVKTRAPDRSPGRRANLVVS
ncbi:hypothetical protein M8494_32460 [Serratia ureilytica]